MDQAPQKFDMKDAVPLDSAPPAKFDMGNAVPLVDFTSNENSEGTYEMLGPDGKKKVKIPYSMISTASQAGYKMTDADRERYVTDAKYDPKLKDEVTPEGVKVAGKNSAGESIYAPKGIEGRTMLGSEIDALKGAAKGVVQFLDPRPSEEEKQRGFTTTFDNIMRYPERLIQPNVDMAVQADQEAAAGAAGTNTLDRVAGHSSALEHRLAATIPLVGPWMASVVDQSGAQAAQGNYGGAAGTVVGNAMVAEAPGMGSKIVKGVAEVIPKVGRAGVEAITRTGPRQLKEMAETTVENNKAAADKAIEDNKEAEKKHLGSTLDALQKTREAEDSYSHDQQTAKNKLDAENEANRKKFNEDELKRIKEEGEKREKEVVKRQGDLAGYDKELKQVREENAKRYRREVKRQNLESQKLDNDKTMHQKFKSAYNKARGVYNDTWNSWRKMVTNEKADMSTPVDTIRAQEKSMNPQQISIFRDILRETQPTGADVSELQKLRDDIGRGTYKTTYADASPTTRKAIDKMVARVNLDEVSAGGASASALKDVPAERLHGWKSQLERAVRTTTDGTIKYAIGQVLDSLREEEGNVSRRVGPKAEAQLYKARAITGPYFDAFISKPSSATRAADATLRAETPEFTKARLEREQLERIAAYDPTIAATASKGARLQEALDNISAELPPQRGGTPKNPAQPYKDVPNIPKGATVIPGKGVVVNTRTLPPEPVPAGQFAPKPFEAGAPPERAPIQDRPEEVIAERGTISPEDIRNARGENVKGSAKSLREHGIRRSMNALFYTVPSAVFSAMLGHPGYAIAELLSTPSILAGSHALADLLEKREVVNWIGKVTDKDVEQWNKLPPEQKAVFTEDMKTLAQAAKKKGITVSPLLMNFLKAGTATGAANATRKRKSTPQELLDQAHQNLQSQFQQSGLAP